MNLIVLIISITFEYYDKYHGILNLKYQEAANKSD